MLSCRCKPVAGHKEDALLERAFWSSITLSPPFYGADTPCSFFDEHLRFGWNLRSLKCLLSHHDMPDIPGVTTPMTYFGMWKVLVITATDLLNRVISKPYFSLMDEFASP